MLFYRPKVKKLYVNFVAKNVKPKARLTMQTYLAAMRHYLYLGN